MASSEEQRKDRDKPPTECVLHKTKTIQFFGRSTPIVLQNDNGPCPLLAICNVLLLRNQLNLGPDISEVSQEKLLSLVADRCNGMQNKDEGYAENRRKNIADVLDLLPRLTTGVDVNTKFRRIDDFEFTSGCAIFDLLDIPLYHGWLVDPQDHDTAEAIGSKSYNILMGDLVSLETRKMENGRKGKLDEDSIDFAAATAATLGVPSPNLSRAKSFDESPCAASNQLRLRKGDAEEAAELLRILKLSENVMSVEGDESCQAATSGGDVMMSSHENVHMMKYAPENPVHTSDTDNCSRSADVEPSISGSGDMPSTGSPFDKQATSAATDAREGQVDQLIAVQPEENSLPNHLAAADVPVHSESIPPLSPAKDTVHNQGVECLSVLPDPVNGSHKENGEGNSTLNTSHADSESASGRMGAIESFASSLDSSEPIYEGEECILDSRETACENREPVYEGEVVLAERAVKGTRDVNDAVGQKREITHQQGELYLLATDQGYMNQPDLVWEKLNEVNGDTLFMTSSFKEFRLESSSNATWDEQNALASTADYLASIDNSSQAVSNMKFINSVTESSAACNSSDLQLAIALQQQEFEQQPQRNPPQQPSSGSSSRLITGPQWLNFYIGHTVNVAF
ncbi:hypothetical protein Cgig2_016841 [Carnegiea gigantea]|uniref:MINDY deubiquitinase domain-containing protein n=1 Tax=Carnegiea gigantea TaxID=171969 RepID=A0A9Q1GWI6_9CARY|nr:hypothetical protein Cgig2_016841 [Carnegiea gigantea]